jgi:Skp family chaperone for outer membrane proteins
MKYAALTLAFALGLCVSAQAATPVASHAAVTATKLGITSGAVVLKAADTTDTKAKKKKKKKKAPAPSNS